MFSPIVIAASSPSVAIHFFKRTIYSCGPCVVFCFLYIMNKYKIQHFMISWLARLFGILTNTN